MLTNTENFKIVFKRPKIILPQNFLLDFFNLKINKNVFDTFAAFANQVMMVLEQSAFVPFFLVAKNNFFCKFLVRQNFNASVYTNLVCVLMFLFDACQNFHC